MSELLAVAEPDIPLEVVVSVERELPEELLLIPDPLAPVPPIGEEGAPAEGVVPLDEPMPELMPELLPVPEAPIPDDLVPLPLVPLVVDEGAPAEGVVPLDDPVEPLLLGAGVDVLEPVPEAPVPDPAVPPVWACGAAHHIAAVRALIVRIL